MFINLNESLSYGKDLFENTVIFLKKAARTDILGKISTAAKKAARRRNK